MDALLLLAPLPLPDGRPHPARTGLSAAAARHGELLGVCGARGRWSLASPGHALAGAGDDARRELRPRAAALGSRDADRERRPPAHRRLAAAALARRAREPHAVPERFRGAHGRTRSALEGIASPLFALAGDLSARADRTQPATAAGARREVAQHLGAGYRVVPRLLVHRRRRDARMARPGGHGARPLEPVSRRPALHGAEHVLC